MRALVTGSTGLLGNNLLRTLIDAGHEVWTLARAQFGALFHTQDFLEGQMQKRKAENPSTTESKRESKNTRAIDLGRFNPM